MSVPYLLMDYVPWGAGGPKPALLAWFEHRSPMLYGVGVQPGLPFDPVAFASAFPTEVDVAWVFAEWVDALRDLCQTGIDRDALREVLMDTPDAAVSERELGHADTLTPLLSRMSTAAIPKKPAALGALAYLVREEAPGLEVSAERGRLKVSTEAGAVVALLELKRAAPGLDWQVFARPQAGRPATVITGLAAADCRTKLRDGLAPWVT